ncbi:hypothetical protein LG3211_2630 [Lysobacter gummosus]|nr:hypothetical protein LG3211_2630 [Lysobacter gummosus]
MKEVAPGRYASVDGCGRVEDENDGAACAPYGVAGFSDLSQLMECTELACPSELRRTGDEFDGKRQAARTRN